MKTSKYYLAAGFFGALLFCGGKSSIAQAISSDGNKETIELVGQPKAFSSGEVFLPSFLNTYGDLIIIQDDADSMVYKVFNKNTLEFVASFGKREWGQMRFRSVQQQFIKILRIVEVLNFTISGKSVS
jgi:hypothetical protein